MCLGHVAVNPVAALAPACRPSVSIKRRIEQEKPMNDYSPPGNRIAKSFSRLLTMSCFDGSLVAPEEWPRSLVKPDHGITLVRGMRLIPGLGSEPLEHIV